jgi:class 3 adenylate cyclase
MLLGEAEAESGDHQRASMEIRAARDAFERLGAVPDLRTADARLQVIEPAGAGPGQGDSRRAMKTFVFTDVVDSTRLAGTLGDEAWGTLLRWHDQTIRSIVAEHGGEEIKATGDGFFLAFGDVDLAIEASIAIQRRLAQHRLEQGFAPGVRIGLHRAEANRAGLDYIGSGVNQAARIAAQAGESEVLVSATSLDAARRPFREVGRRTLSLKGIDRPVDVVSVAIR